MINRYFILVFFLLSILFASCVSKKKYLEMQDGRLNAEEQVRQLTAENNARAARIQAMIADFESMKNELMESNAIKDQYIDNLNREIAELSGRLDEQLESFRQKNFSFGFETERLSETLEAKEKTIRSLEAKIKELENDLSRQSASLSDRNIRISTLDQRVSILEAEKAKGERQQQELLQQVQNAKDETNALKAEIKEKEETIVRLQNNVNLLKRELGRGEN